MCGQIAYDWNTTPQLRCSGSTLTRPCSKTTRSPKAMLPESGSCRPAMDHKVVDFPQPLGPSRVKISPSRTVSDSSCSAVCPGKCLVRLFRWRLGTRTHPQQGTARAQYDQRDAHLDPSQRGDAPADACRCQLQHGQAEY